MRLSLLQRSILAGVFRDRDMIAALDWHAADRMNTLERGAYRLRIDAAKKGLVRPNLAEWLGGEPTRSDFTMATRAYEKLHQLGLLVRHGDRRTTHLSLTPAGERLARKMT